MEQSYDLPDGVYNREILPYAPLLHGVKEAFADPNTGIAPSLMDIDPESIDTFYAACTERIASLMKLEQQGHPAAQTVGVALYDQVDTPYFFYPGYNTDAMDYQLLLSYLIVLMCAVIVAPIFTSDYQTGADDIYRCTRYGKGKLVLTKILSALLICTMVYCICAVLYLFASNSLFGWECTKTSMQMLYSVVNLPNWTIGELQIGCAVGYLLSLLASVSFTLFLSAKFRNVITTLAVSLLFCILPVVIYLAFPAEIGNWLYPFLPASGTALQASFLYAFADFSFWSIGNTAVWLPQAMTVICCVEVPVFLGLTAWSYCSHKVG